MPEPDPNHVYLDPLSRENVDPLSRSHFEPLVRGADSLTPDAFDSEGRDLFDAGARGVCDPEARIVLDPREQGESEPFAQSGSESRKQRLFDPQRELHTEPQTRAASGSQTRSIPDAQARRMLPAPRYGIWLPIATATALVLALGALSWAFLLQKRLMNTEQKLAIAEEGSTAFSRKLAEADAKIRANTANVDEQLTETQQRQQDLATWAAAIASLQRNDASRLEQGVADTSKKLGAVQTAVSSVKTEVASTRSDVAATRTDLADTKQILQRTIGDAGVMSGLIAQNHDELEVLKHRGDRTYYEFTLHKGAQPTLLSSSVKVQLKKTNDKKGRYTLMVSSDDRNIEKKDKTVLEPVQFYNGKNPQLFEIVVNSMAKDVVGGYMSVPRGL